MNFDKNGFYFWKYKFSKASKKIFVKGLDRSSEEGRASGLDYLGSSLGCTVELLPVPDRVERFGTEENIWSILNWPRWGWVGAWKQKFIILKFIFYYLKNVSTNRLRSELSVQERS